MCRLLVVISHDNLSPKDIQRYLWGEEHAIFKQCHHIPYTPGDEGNTKNREVNIDGFGVGFYHDDKAKVYRNITNAWHDPHLKSLIDLMDTNMLIAHIRATVSNFTREISPVHSYNAHPFIYDKYIFCHNGFLGSFTNGIFRKNIYNFIDDIFLTHILGNTDSEYIFFVILTFINRGFSMIEAVKETFHLLNQFDKQGEVTANIILTDHYETIITRYTNKQIGPSLYISECNNKIIFASEPLVKKCPKWHLIEQNKLIHICQGRVSSFDLEN